MRSATPGARSPPAIRRSWRSTASRSSRAGSTTTVASTARCPRARRGSGGPGAGRPRGGEDDGEALVGEVAGQEGQQVARRAVDPVDVLDDEHGRGQPGKAPEEPEHPLEQPGLGEARGEPGRAGSVEPVPASARAPGRSRRGRRGRARATAPARRCDGAGEPAQGLRDRQVGEPAAPMSRHSPTGRALPAGGRVGASRTRRDLPIPASPRTTTNLGEPAALASISRTRAATSPSRPTSFGLEALVDTATMVRRCSRFPRTSGPSHEPKAPPQSGRRLGVRAGTRVPRRARHAWAITGRCGCRSGRRSHRSVSDRTRRMEWRRRTGPWPSRGR